VAAVADVEADVGGVVHGYMETQVFARIESKG
jgi:hypothetical protein